MENREETNGRQVFRRDPTSRSVPKSQHDSPSPEGSLIRLLAGLLTLASSGWPPSRSLAGISGFVDQSSTITVAGPSRILTGFPIKFPKTTPEATTKLLHPQNDIGQAARAAIQVADFQPPPSDYSAHDAQKGCSMDIRRFVFLIVKQSDY